MNLRIKDFIPLAALVTIGSLIYFHWQNNSTKNVVSQPVVENSDTNNLETWDVVPNSVHDGDTIRVQRNGQILKIRFACIDAPEISQPMGVEARDYLRSLLSEAHNQVKVNPITTDKYGRTVAELWSKDGLIQSLMAVKGMAYPYAKYSKDCPNWQAVQSSGNYAQANHFGVWSDPNLEKPWDYRRKKG